MAEFRHGPDESYDRAEDARGEEYLEEQRLDRLAERAPLPDPPSQQDARHAAADGMVRQIEAFLAQHRVSPDTRRILEDTRADLKRLGS